MKKPADNPASKTVLVVDDEPDVRKLVAAMLTGRGYNVVTADSGDHAISYFKKQTTPIDLLVTDVVTPGISGPMLADRLTELQPDLKVLFISGYDDTQVVQHYIVDKGFAFLAKPFTMDDLGTKVAEVLDHPANANYSGV